MNTFNQESLKKELEIDAKAVGIANGASEIFIKKTLDSVKKSLKAKQIITENDLKRLVIKELKKYNKDLAYVYENRDKII